MQLCVFWCNAVSVWLTQETEKHYERKVIRRKKIDWNYTSRNGHAEGSTLHQLNGLQCRAGKTNWTPVVACALMCPSVSHKGRAGKQSSWWLYRVARLSEWGNRRWHLADSLTLADLLGVGWLLWFWNYSLDELEHFTTKKSCSRNGSGWGWVSTQREGSRRKRRWTFYDWIVKVNQQNQHCGSDITETKYDKHWLH